MTLFVSYDPQTSVLIIIIIIIRFGTGLSTRMGTGLSNGLCTGLGTVLGAFSVKADNVPTKLKSS